MKELNMIFCSDNVKVYQLDFKIRNCPVLRPTIRERNLMKTLLNEPWVMDEDVSESIDKIAISDAFTHIERLVFPAFWIKNNKTGERKICWEHTQIDGVWTMKMYGGDSRKVYSPETYVRHLRNLNKEN